MGYMGFHAEGETGDIFESDCVADCPKPTIIHNLPLAATVLLVFIV